MTPANVNVSLNRQAAGYEMKLKTRRIEITASRQRVAIISDDPGASGEHEALSLIELKSWDTTVVPDSDEGRKLIIETITMLEDIIGSREI